MIKNKKEFILAVVIVLAIIVVQAAITWIYEFMIEYHILHYIKEVVRWIM